MAAETGVGVLPVTGEGTPGTVVPYPVVNPYSKVTAVEMPLASIVPLSVAVVPVTPVAPPVTTVGEAGPMFNPRW
jgi:hypothetical protein